MISSDNDKLLKLMPPVTAGCLKECQIAANKADGCAENDFTCHCVNYNTYSDVRFPFYLPLILPSIPKRVPTITYHRTPLN